MAITSKNFCTSARLAFSLVVRNAGRFSMTNSIGGMLIFLGRLLIAVLSGWIGYLIIMNSDLKDEVYSPVFPVIVVVIISVLLSVIFLSVFSFSATTILHCFLIDEEVGGNRHPESLNEFLEVNDKINTNRGRV